MDNTEERGRQASVDGFAHEHIAAGILTKENRNASANPKNSLTLNPFFRYNIARKLF